MITLLKKDLKLFFGNKQDILLTFALPVIFITLFASVFGKSQGSEEGNLMGLVQAVAGTSVMMLLFSVAGIGGTILDEKQEGVLKKLLCAPIHPNYILFGKLVFSMIISIIQLIIMFLFAWIAFGLDILSYIPSLLVMFIAVSFACSGFGIILAAFAKTRQQVQGYSTIIVLVMSAIGGSMIPLFALPDIIQKIAVVSVNYWGVQGFFDIFWKQLPLGDITFLTRVFVLLAIGVFLNIIAFLLYRRNILNLV